MYRKGRRLTNQVVHFRIIRPSWKMARSMLHVCNLTVLEGVWPKCNDETGSKLLEDLWLFGLWFWNIRERSERNVTTSNSSYMGENGALSMTSEKKHSDVMSTWSRRFLSSISCYNSGLRNCPQLCVERFQHTIL